MGLLLPRDPSNSNDDDPNDPYWDYSPTSEAIKWAIVAAIVLFFFCWIVGGYYHAQRRVKKGLRPMAYHFFLLPRHQRAQFIASPQAYYPYPYPYGPHPHEHPMQNYPQPPPAYNADHLAPPQYQPPEGATKINPEQDWAPPPSGAPPAQNSQAGESSNSTHIAPANAGPSGATEPSTESRPDKKEPGFFSKINPLK